MNFLNERRQQRIDQDVEDQADYVADRVQAQIDEGLTPPYVAFARVRGLKPEETAKAVGQAAIGILGEQEFMLDAKAAEEESSLVHEGAIIRVIPQESAPSQ